MIPEQAGSFLRFCQVLCSRNVTEFNYRYDDPKSARIFVGVALNEGRAEKEQILRAVADAGYHVIDMTDDEMAKLHVRYMVGGHARGLQHERLFRFEFPERPGALLRFLQSIGGRWNISLFHYRNHGSDHGRVLAGVQASPRRRGRSSRNAPASCGHEYTEETSNPATACS